MAFKIDMRGARNAKFMSYLHIKNVIIMIIILTFNDWKCICEFAYVYNNSNFKVFFMFREKKICRLKKNNNKKGNNREKSRDFLYDVCYMKKCFTLEDIFLNNNI